MKREKREARRRLDREAGHISTLSTPDLLAAEEAFLTLIPQHLANGEIVESGDFGSFRLLSSVEGAESPAKVRGQQLTSLIPDFMASKEVKGTPDTIEFEKLRRRVE